MEKKRKKRGGKEIDNVIDTVLSGYRSLFLRYW